MGKQKATFDQLFPRYTYTVYDYKLLQRSKRYLPSWHWILVSVKSLYIRKATASVGPKKHFWFTLEKTTQCSLSVCPTQARACAACSASPPAIVSITSHRLPFSLCCTPKELNHYWCNEGRENACRLLEGCFHKRSWYLWFHCLVQSCTDSMIPERINQLPG